MTSSGSAPATPPGPHKQSPHWTTAYKAEEEQLLALLNFMDMPPPPARRPLKRLQYLGPLPEPNEEGVATLLRMCGENAYGITHTRMSAIQAAAPEEPTQATQKPTEESENEDVSSDSGASSPEEEPDTGMSEPDEEVVEEVAEPPKPKRAKPAPKKVEEVD